jgi:uncharacterized protein YjcR
MNWEDIRKEYESSDITLKALAEKHDVKLGTLKSRKSREGWEKDATATQKDATSKKKDSPDKQKKRSGNPNPENQFTKRNTAARKHGLRSKYFTDTQREIMEDFEDFSIADQLWLQIEIKFSAIIQLQKVMWVENSYDTLNEVSMKSSGADGSVTSYKVAYGYEQYESYIKAQARAMAEYRNLAKQFLELSSEDDIRRLKLEQMKLGIEKTKAEIDNLNDDGQEDSDIEIRIVRKGERT